MRIVHVAPEKPVSVNTYVSVVRARQVAPYTLAITFSDGTERVVDFGPFLRSSQHPAVRAYLDEARFGKFDIIGGNLNWNDYDLIFPVADLYAGKIS